jgi:hypothetical protein
MFAPAEREALKRRYPKSKSLREACSLDHELRRAWKLGTWDPRKVGENPPVLQHDSHNRNCPLCAA